MAPSDRKNPPRGGAAAEIQSQRHLEPFLKWPGGKRWLASLLCNAIRPELKGTYYEPFLGAGAVFLCLRPEKAVLSDVNTQLIECVRTASRCPHAVARELSRWSNTRQCYERVRRAHYSDVCARAARFTYLAKTCWGGIYRVNKHGDFNVPFGGSGRAVYTEDEFIASARAFRGASVQSSDFEDVIRMASEGDVIYADPPYTTLGQNNGFLRYNEHLFAWKDQTRLAKACRKAAQAGAFVVVSGLWHESVLVAPVRVNPMRRIHRACRPVTTNTRLSNLHPRNEAHQQPSRTPDPPPDASLPVTLKLAPNEWGGKKRVDRAISRGTRNNAHILAWRCHPPVPTPRRGAEQQWSAAPRPRPSALVDQRTS